MHIRYYKDSFIAAEEMTYGCSSTSTSSSTCFGASRGEQNRTGLIVIIVGAVFVAVEAGAILACVSVCKKKAMKKSGALLDNESIPTAQVSQAAYAQSSQPAYAQPAAQPNYGAPNYGQPAFAQPVNQPNYGAPNYGQPAFAQPVTQPNYGQPNYGVSNYGQPGTM